ncbi:MAG: sodium:calcium antiporter [bacterium]|nr:sodium:calcium antiporter [bacterium]
MIFYFILFLVSVFLLVFAGGRAVETLTRISRFLKLREFIVAFILMAFATSIPELFVGISAAFSNVPELSFGDVLGANIINLTLAVGLAALFLGGLEIERETVRRGSILMGVVGLLPLLLILDGEISRIDGCILLLAFIFYLTWLFDREEFFRKVYDNLDPTIVNFKNFLKDLAMFGGAIILLLLASQGIVKAAVFFAVSLGVELGIIGIFLVGAGTALPEVYFSIRAGRAGETKMILGNLMGCVVITSTLVLGLVSLIQPIRISDPSPYGVARIFLLISVLFFLFISRTKSQISKKEGLALILIYIAFLVSELALK